MSELRVSAVPDSGDYTAYRTGMVCMEILVAPRKMRARLRGFMSGLLLLENTGFRVHVLRNLIGQFESADV